MRVNVQLIDAGSGNHLWADHFDKPLADLFDLQDEIVARLAGALKAQASRFTYGSDAMPHISGNMRSPSRKGSNSNPQFRRPVFINPFRGPGPSDNEAESNHKRLA
jgi:hypothetical protein